MKDAADSIKGTSPTIEEFVSRSENLERINKKLGVYKDKFD
jgi:hypothetical protein